MLIALIDVVSCENPKCRDFAKIVPGTHGVTSYYCPVCGKISYPRTVDAALADSPERYKEYLQRTMNSIELT
ncbi:hypothetical protein LLG46_13910 [bacterium]|nr:hypothetical protein [bacterium]